MPLSTRPARRGTPLSSPAAGRCRGSRTTARTAATVRRRRRGVFAERAAAAADLTRARSSSARPASVLAGGGVGRQLAQAVTPGIGVLEAPAAVVRAGRRAAFSARAAPGLCRWLAARTVGDGDQQRDGSVQQVGDHSLAQPVLDREVGLGGRGGTGPDLATGRVGLVSRSGGARRGPYGTRGRQQHDHRHTVSREILDGRPPGRRVACFDPNRVGTAAA